MNNSVVLLEDIGEGDNALLCFTERLTCCDGGNRAGEFFFPNGTLVQISSSNANFYRNRGIKHIRLNRRNDATTPTGRYRCQIPDASGELQDIFIHIGN